MPPHECLLLLSCARYLVHSRLTICWNFHHRRVNFSFRRLHHPQPPPLIPTPTQTPTAIHNPQSTTHNPRTTYPQPATYETTHTQNGAVVGVATDSSGAEDELDRPGIDSAIKQPALGTTTTGTSTSTSSSSDSSRRRDGGDGGGGDVDGGGPCRGRWASDAAVEPRGLGGEQLKLVTLEPGQNIGPYRLQVRL